MLHKQKKHKILTTNTNIVFMYKSS